MRHARPVVAGFVLSLGVFPIACRQREEKQSPPPPRAMVIRESIRIRCARPSRDALFSAPLLETPRLLNEIYRLQPDRRFLLAVGEIHRLFDGKRDKEVRVAFTEGKWAIDSNGERVGSVPDLATYSDFTRALSLWIGRLKDRYPSPQAAPFEEADRARIEKKVDEFLAPSLIGALEDLDGLWKKGVRDPGLVDLASRGYVRLCLQRLDQLGMTDSLLARALALRALSDSGGLPESRREHALLANLMGYEVDAIESASKLPSADPVRLFVFGESRALLDKVQINPGDRLGQYLGLLAVAGEGKTAWAGWGKPDIWSSWHERYFFEKGLTLPVLRTAVEVDAFETNLPVSNAILHAVMLELSASPSEQGAETRERVPADLTERLLQAFIENVRSSLQIQPEGLVARFEAALASRSPKSDGVFWDSESFRAFFRGYFYSALFTLGRHYADSLASGPASIEFAKYLEGSPEGPGAQFARWYTDEVSIRYGSPPEAKRLIEDFTSLDEIGPLVLVRLLDAMGSYLTWDSELTPAVMQPFVRRLDSRMAHQRLLLNPAFFPLQDLNLTARLCRNLMSRAPSESVWFRGWCTDFLGNERGLLALIDRKELDLATRSAALSYAIEKNRLSEAAIRERFRRFLEESNYDRSITAPYLEYLEFRVEDYAEGRRVAEGFVSRHKPEGLLLSIYRGRQAHLMELEGRYKEAWAVIEPELSSGQGAVMAWAASILQRLGRREEAITLAKQAVERYPDSHSGRGDLAEILWRERRYSEAALVLDHPRMTLATWRYNIGRSFDRTFRGREEREAVEAFDPLVAQRINRWNLQQIVEPIGETRPSLAFALQSRMKRPFVMDIVGPRFQAYKYLKSWKGRDEATRWLHDNIPQNLREVASADFYDEEDFDLLWTIVEPLPGKDLLPYTWLLRAGAAAYRGLDRDPHRAELLAHYQKRDDAEFEFQLGRYVLGLDDAAVVAGLPMSRKQRSQAEYFFGVRALAEGRVSDAADWYRVVIETESPQEILLLARHALGRWADRSRAPAVDSGKRVW